MIEHYFWMAVSIGTAIAMLVFVINIPRLHRLMMQELCIGDKINAAIKADKAANRREQ